jgi:hypothetical protein
MRLGGELAGLTTVGFDALFRVMGWTDAAKWEEQRKHSAMMVLHGRAAECYPAAMFSNNSFCNPQAQACSCELLCGNKRLKHTPLQVPRDAGAIIGNSHPDSALTVDLPALTRADANAYPSAVTSRFKRIAYQARENLTQVVAKAIQFLGGPVIAFEYDG